MLTGESPRVMGAGGAAFFRKSTSISAVFRAFSSQVFATAPGCQMVNLPPVSALIPTRDESDEGGEELKNAALRGKRCLWFESQRHASPASGTCSWESLSCSRAGMTVLKAELKPTIRILA